MSKRLVLAEKPSVGKDLARVLNCRQKGNSCFENNKYIVTWALGHLVELADPDAYNENYASWRIEDLPILPSQLKLVVIKQSGKQFNIVKKLMHNNEVSEIIIATDAGREGELVASAALSAADWFVGINATRALTCKYNAQLSCGRVQTPTLAIITQREEEIRNFKPRTYYGITASAHGLKLIWQDRQTKDTKTFNKDKYNQILKSIRNKDAEVIEVNKTYKKNYPPLLYDLTELQRDTHKIYGFSAKETLSIMQNLYERHKLLTYPRTDSRYISTDVVDTLPERIKACGVGPYAKMAFQVLKKPIQANKSFVDNSRVSDHHAIIPTEQRFSGSLSDRERKIYDLVIKRFLGRNQTPGTL